MFNTKKVSVTSFGKCGHNQLTLNAGYSKAFKVRTDTEKELDALKLKAEIFVSDQGLSKPCVVTFGTVKESHSILIK